MKRALLVLALAACKQKAAAPPPPEPVAAMPAAEAQRSGDACKAYEQKVCACAETVPAAKPPCDLAHALPDAVRLSLEIAANPETAKADALRAQQHVRESAKECIEQTAKLPALGCL